MNLISYLAGELFTTVRFGNGTSTDLLLELPTNSTDLIPTISKSNLTIAEYEGQAGVDTFPNITLINQLQNAAIALGIAALSAQRTN